MDLGNLHNYSNPNCCKKLESTNFFIVHIFNSTLTGSEKISDGTHVLLRIIWFLLFGWWLGPLYFTLVSFFVIIGFGYLWMEHTWTVMTLNGPPKPQKVAQRNGFVRFLWFIFFGWWLAAFYVSLCGLLMPFIVGFYLVSNGVPWKIATLPNYHEGYYYGYQQQHSHQQDQTHWKDPRVVEW